MLVLVTQVVEWVREDKGYWLSSQSPRRPWKLHPGSIAWKGQRSLGICDDLRDAQG